ncbi:fibronectin type III domain-containing protein [Halobacteria archaeon AArc-m2/3/4]|uniref:Fibronectin type III domain-containing protein n=1 Tax=Natronoglomus mannanivorans TaxID=2979990 RepID=A0ABT2QF72_9EURY|nr:fibronectin type III domain-containing protein [Halobacteria archaeon AArc-m2/3/4]
MRENRRTFLRTIGAIGIGSAVATGSTTAQSSDETEVVTLENVGVDSPSSELAPDDGFADTSWIADEEFVVLRVTNLDATGEGSLKWALEVNLGDIGLEEGAPRLIVFEVGGVIDLDGEDIQAERKNVYVAGQTAPEPGITIIRSDKPGVEFDEENQFVQHIRSMPGDQTSDAADAMVAGDNGFNIVFDHCSVFFGTEESMSVNAGSDSEDITFSNNMIALPLFDAPVHSDSTRAYGTLFGNGMDTGALLGNLYAHTWSRNPRLKGGTEAMVANNVWYNFERGMRIGDDQDDPNYVNMVGNRHIAGEAADFDRPIVYTQHDESDPPIHLYLADNEYDDGYTLVDEDDEFVFEDEPIDEYWPDTFSPMDGDPLEHALSNVGARPAERIDLEEQVLADVQNGTGEIIDSQDEVGGYPDLPSTTRELEIPDGDITDWLIQHTRAVELGEEPPNGGNGEPEPQPQPPSAPTGLASPAQSTTGFDIEWTAAEPGDEPIGSYSVSVDGTVLETVDSGTTSTTLTGLDPGTTYTVGVVAVDTDGNESQEVTIQVETESDETPGEPGVPTGLEVVSTGETSVEIAWNDDVHAVEYVVSVDGSVDQETTASAATVTGLTADTSYEIGVSAVGEDGTETDAATITVTTDEADDDPVDAIAEIGPSATSVEAGEFVSFQVVDTSGNTNWITDLAWDLGDGTTAEGWWVGHAYDEPGNYVVALTATNDEGDQTTVDVTITVS